MVICVSISVCGIGTFEMFVPFCGEVLALLGVKAKTSIVMLRGGEIGV